MRVIGYKKNEFKTDKGEVVKGYNIFLGYTVDEEKGFGFNPLNRNFWVSEKKFNEFCISDICRKGVNVEPTINLYGKLSGFKVITNEG